MKRLIGLHHDSIDNTRLAELTQLLGRIANTAKITGRVKAHANQQSSFQAILPTTNSIRLHHARLGILHSLVLFHSTEPLSHDGYYASHLPPANFLKLHKTSSDPDHRRLLVFGSIAFSSNTNVNLNRMTLRQETTFDNCKLVRGTPFVWVTRRIFAVPTSINRAVESRSDDNGLLLCTDTRVLAYPLIPSRPSVDAVASNVASDINISDGNDETLFSASIPIVAKDSNAANFPSEATVGVVKIQNAISLNAPPPPSPPSPPPTRQPQSQPSTSTPTFSFHHRLSAVEIFQYSALTNNCHLIHYNKDYAKHEGYYDCIVPGTLLASIACTHVERELAKSSGSRTDGGKNEIITKYKYHLVKPVLVGQEFVVHGDGSGKVWIDSEGVNSDEENQNKLVMHATYSTSMLTS
ncbi:hypothetical protein HK100_002839 [Physocladia obscura]|uniref:MaoC-like domain-containing protein n=1 Tax=Physocladia obscura TaxID=109957 RepID=A0AAD5SUW3_9FUNG|nr:hypothetical protein HK100_002839 [Physocladia obscura]